MTGIETFDVQIYRDGEWWMVEIPAIGGLTQARRRGEVEEMATSYIAVDQGLAPSDFEFQMISTGSIDGG